MIINYRTTKFSHMLLSLSCLSLHRINTGTSRQSTEQCESVPADTSDTQVSTTKSKQEKGERTNRALILLCVYVCQCVCFCLTLTIGINRRLHRELWDRERATTKTPPHVLQQTPLPWRRRESRLRWDPVTPVSQASESLPVKSNHRRAISL